MLRSSMHPNQNLLNQQCEVDEVCDEWAVCEGCDSNPLPMEYYLGDESSDLFFGCITMYEGFSTK